MTNKLFDSAPGRPGAMRGPIDLSQSVAGEEDPGATIDPAGRPGGAQPPMSPGDEAPAGTPGTGEDVCPRCGGSGRLAGRACPQCEGTGKVNRGVGGA